MADKAIPTSISLTADDASTLKRVMSKNGMTNRSDLVRMLVRKADAGAAKAGMLAGLNRGEPDISGTPSAAGIRELISKMAGVPVAAGVDYPGMDLTAYDVALVVARAHLDEIRAGVLPMVDEDMVSIGLNPYGEDVWAIYMEALPEFFRVLFGLDRPPTTDIRYEPLERVDGQDFGAVRGEAVSCDTIYPHGEKRMYVRVVLEVGGTRVVVVAPGSGLGVVVGMPVYAAGRFAVSRRRIMLRASKCVTARVDGFGLLYEMAERWGLSELAAYRVVEMLRQRHGDRAPDFCRSFVAYMGMHEAMSRVSLSLEMPTGMSVLLRYDDVRASPDGEKAMQECVTLWPRVMAKAEVVGAV